MTFDLMSDMLMFTSYIFIYPVSNMYMYTYYDLCTIPSKLSTHSCYIQF